MDISPTFTLPRLRGLRLNILLILLLQTLLPSTHARLWSPTDLPHPNKDPDACRRPNTPHSSICDPEAHLTPAHADTIDGIINFIHAGTNGFRKPPCPLLSNPEESPSPQQQQQQQQQQSPPTDGAQLAVAIVDKIAPQPETDTQTTAFTFARILHDHWGVGNPHCQNGILLLFAISNHTFAISTGRGVKSLLPDTAIPTIATKLRPKLRAAQYGPAIIDAVTMAGNLVSGLRVAGTGTEGEEGGKNVEEEELVGQIVAILFFALVFSSFFAVAHLQSAWNRRRYRRCCSVLERMDRDRALANEKRYVSTSCPICLEDFPSEGDGGKEGERREDEQAGSSVRGGESGSNAGGDDGEGGSGDGGSDGKGRGGVGKVAGVVKGVLGGGSLKVKEGMVEKKTLSLPCGHKYHEKCISTWIEGPNKANATCPICRQAIDDTTATSPPSSSSSSSSSMTATAGREGGDNVGQGVSAASSSSSGGATLVRRRRAGGGNGVGTGGWEVYEEEYRFRMRRAREYYPDFITESMMREWELARCDWGHRMARSAAFRSVDPVVVGREARVSGRRGSSFSFGGVGGRGGGSSRGGGGGAAGW